AEARQLRRQHVQPRLQDRPPLQGSRAHPRIGSRAGRSAAGDRGRAGAVQCATREGPWRPRPLRGHHAPGRSRGHSRVRATVDRAGLDSQGRSSKVQIRRVKKGDLSRIRDVIEQTFADFLERQLGTRPRQAFGGAQYVHHRWLMEPWGCFVAEEDGAKIVGTALAVNWGSVGILGPVAVLTDYHTQTIGEQRTRAVEEFFEENRVSLHGGATYPNTPNHFFLYPRFGYKPKPLPAVMPRVLDPPTQARPPLAAPAPL